MRFLRLLVSPRAAVTLLLLLVGVAAACIFLFPAGAEASGGQGFVGSIFSPVDWFRKLLRGIAKWLFPTSMMDKSLGLVKWLVAVPHPDQKWRHINELHGYMCALGGGILTLTIALGIVRYYLAGITGATHPAEVLPRIVFVGGMLVLYKPVFAQVLTFTNVVTHTMLSWPIVAENLSEMWREFGVASFSGEGWMGGVMVLLAILAAFLIITLLVMKVAIIFLFAILFIVGPVVIALYPIPEASHLLKGWVAALSSVVMIPIGWCVIFVTAGALVGDIGNFGVQNGVAKELDGTALAAIAAILTFYMAYKWPLIVLTQVKGFASNFGVSGSSATGGVRSSLGTAAKVAGYAKVAQTISRLPAAAASAGAGAGAGVVGAIGTLRASRKTRTAASGSSPAGNAAAAATGKAGSAGSGNKKTIRGTATEQPTTKKANKNTTPVQTPRIYFYREWREKRR